MAVHPGGRPLRFFVGGSVDDGKSTLIGRLLLQCGAIPDDQLQALDTDSARHGTVGKVADAALLLDGLESEREQGITIDVAYRYFSTPRRSFVVADTPGHESYTRNVATGASNAQLAIIVVDARQGMLTQSRRHILIARLVGVRHIVLAVNKIDLAGWNEAVYREFSDAFFSYVGPLDFASAAAIPLSALHGDNVAVKSTNMPWYGGPSLLDYLETIETEAPATAQALRLPVQLCLRPAPDARFYAGTLSSGTLEVGQTVQIASSGAQVRVKDMYVAGVRARTASCGDAVAIEIDQHLDIGRGELICTGDNMPAVTTQFMAQLICTDAAGIVAGRSYLLKIGPQPVPATVTGIKYRLNIDSRSREPARVLEINDVGACTLSTVGNVVVDPFRDFPETGRFILIDRFSGATVAAGTVDHALRRGTNVGWQHLDVSREVRAQLKHQHPCVVWLTGLSGAGKSTIANLVERRLAQLGCHTYLLDGDNLRHGLNSDLGFTMADRTENIRRAGEVAKLFVDAGLIVLCSFISPYRTDRDTVRAMLGPSEFMEIFVDAPLEVCEARDPKGLYAKSRRGLIPNFTGIDAPYEVPLNPELVLKSGQHDAQALAAQVVQLLKDRGVVPDTGDLGH